MTEQNQQNDKDKTGWRAMRDDALRANLLKRKQQARARAVEPPAGKDK